MNFLKLFICINILLTQSYSLSQISNKNGETYTTEISIKFKIKAFDKIDEKGIAKISDLKNELIVAKNFFQKFGDIKFKKTFIDAVYEDTIKLDLQGKQVFVPDLSQFYRVIFPEPVKMWQTVYELRTLKEIEFADPPTFNVSDIVPDDFNGVGDQWYLSKINATSAWDITTGSSSIIVAVIDNGVDRSHSDLVTKITGGETTYYVGDGTENHGTLVAGVVGAATNNGLGISSLGSNIMVRPYNNKNGTGSATDIITAVNSGAQILNCSWRSIIVDPNDNTKYINYDDLIIEMLFKLP